MLRLARPAACGSAHFGVQPTILETSPSLLSERPWCLCAAGQDRPPNDRCCRTCHSPSVDASNRRTSEPVSHARSSRRHDLAQTQWRSAATSSKY